MSTITTHVLDTSKGKPAQGISIVLEKLNADGSWAELGKGQTNTDGRLPGLLANETKLAPGIYRLVFDTASYFKTQGVKAFYPSVTIAFETTDQSHYHVPLLLNPYGYSTYRGS
ncbi:MAG TPA: hydroxyisourate hydrolase [Bacteroidia bacterium]